MRTATILAVLAAFSAAPAAAQAFNPYAPAVSTAAPTAPAVNLGHPLSVTAGPWVLGETLFFSAGQVVSDYSWRDKLHGQTGQLYTASDLASDAEALRSLNVFNRVTPAVYEIPNDPIPAQYSSISISTSQVRLVFDVELKGSTVPVRPRLVTPPSAVSGLILTPTAYRGAGKHNTPGLGLDFNAAYFIGRLYGKNSYPDSPAKTNYIDRLGLWTMTADGKMQLQSDSGWRPAIAVGGQATFVFRDSPQPTINTPAVSVQVNAKTTKLLTDGYFVASKDFHGVRTSVGLMQGNIGDLVGQMSEFLTPEALRFYNHEPNGTIVSSRSVPFGSVFYLLKPDYPIGVEFMKFNGSPANPMLINFKLGRFLHLNFDLGLLKFTGGYDLLGLFQFRFNQFPRN
ncbi:MAG: hypothetical protein KGJ84_01510 [Elusimicrobia bacterium]|nr:hypothetical protein [Elusimicrobiota bacterium]